MFTIRYKTRSSSLLHSRMCRFILAARTHGERNAQLGLSGQPESREHVANASTTTRVTNRTTASTLKGADTKCEQFNADRSKNPQRKPRLGGLSPRRHKRNNRRHKYEELCSTWQIKPDLLGR